ncbi:MAG: gamma-glutamylcyclotransferase [Spirulina sp. SIO3F2]|nr:gamma-glutamylcyclotransferase [Spirulina sp. SIO3F2]
MVRVFVYGTLQPGQANYAAYCGDRVQQVQAAYTFGQLYVLPTGYPALVVGGNAAVRNLHNNRVWGHLLTFVDAEILPQLDELEDFDPQRSPEDNEYQRQRLPMFDPTQRSLGQAWAYVMLPHWVKAAGGKYRASGCWP